MLPSPVSETNWKVTVVVEPWLWAVSHGEDPHSQLVNRREKHAFLPGAVPGGLAVGWEGDGAGKRMES